MNINEKFPLFKSKQRRNERNQIHIEKQHELVNNKAGNAKSTSLNHDAYINKYFWGYVKNVLKSKSSTLPSFSKSDYFSFFTKTFSAFHPGMLFSFPFWIPTLATPQMPFNLDPPSYKQITNIIRNVKVSTSPCSYDQVLKICCRRCPYLRSYLSDIIRAIWVSSTVSSAWKRACTALVHKKGDSDEPSIFRPILLESVPLKIFTSSLRNSTFQFVAVN